MRSKYNHELAGRADEEGQATMKILLMISISVLVVGHTQVLACECRPESTKKTITRLRKEAATIFVGTAKEITKQADSYKATFVVEKWWKGVQNPEIEIFTYGGCMAWFESGKTYLIYASPDKEGKLSTDICMRTRLISYAAEDMKRLGKAKIRRSHHTLEVRSIQWNRF